MISIQFPSRRLRSTNKPHFPAWILSSQDTLPICMFPSCQWRDNSCQPVCFIKLMTHRSHSLTLPCLCKEFFFVPGFFNVVASNYKMLAVELQLCSTTSSMGRITKRRALRLTKKRYFSSLKLFTAQLLCLWGKNWKMGIPPQKTTAFFERWQWQNISVALFSFKIGEPFGTHIVKCSPGWKVHCILLQWNLGCIWHNFQNLLQLGSCTHEYSG